MVAITKQGDNFIFEVKGLHKLWAFTNQLTISEKNIVSVKQNHSRLPFWKGIRMLGTYFPFLISAGTYINNGKTAFWDVVNDKKCLIIELKDSNYSQLFVEVENPDEAMKLLGK